MISYTGGIIGWLIIKVERSFSCGGVRGVRGMNVGVTYIDVGVWCCVSVGDYSDQLVIMYSMLQVIICKVDRIIMTITIIGVII